MFIVIASKQGKSANIYQGCKVQEESVAIPATHEQVHRAETRQECDQWATAHEGKAISTLPAKQPQAGGSISVGGQGGNLPGGGNPPPPGNGTPQRDADPRWFWVSVMQNILIVIVAIGFLWIMLKGIEPGNTFLSGNNDNSPRNLITFLVAFSTVFIALLAILTAMVVRDFKERFAAAKEILIILVGILGTIIGFYFGQASTKDANATQTSTAAQTASRPNGSTNGSPPINTLTNNANTPTNSQTNATNTSN